jgi:hypothetical protein
MSESRKKETETVEETDTDDRELYLRDGKKLIVSEQGSEQLVEIRDAAGMLELRIKLTAEGPVLQMDSVRLQLKASESVAIESPHVAITGSEQLELAGGEVHVAGEEDVKVDAKGEVRVVGKMIWLN